MNNSSCKSSVCLFLRFLGVIYLIAFLSLWSQIDGLIGNNGILPASHFLDLISNRFGGEKYFYFPTICWLNKSDAFLSFLCGAGVVLSLPIILGIANSFIFFFLWLLYLSLVTVSQDFLSFQWDNLLLEIGLLSVFLTPLNILKPGSFIPPRIPLWLLRIVLFKLMFLSGIVKLLSRDEAWLNMTALTYHYETQPLPNVISYYVHFFPLWFHKFSCFLMFVIELIIPFLIFVNYKSRIFAGIVFIFFQILIILTGNYCFFNLLTVALCFLLFDDDTFPVNWEKGRVNPPPTGVVWNRFVICAVTGLIILVTTVQFCNLFRFRINWPLPFKVVYSFIYPFRSINSYGLFSIMTKSRPEIIIEGSNDGISWAPYEFKYNAGDLKKAPCFVAPHQPRLDWQMWFAALGTYRENPWFINFCRRLLEGSKDVQKLMGRNPFSVRPPKYLRALVYDYHFTDFNTKKETGMWWNRELKGVYLPPVTLEGNHLIPASN